MKTEDHSKTKTPHLVQLVLEESLGAIKQMMHRDADDFQKLDVVVDRWNEDKNAEPRLPDDGFR